MLIYQALILYKNNIQLSYNKPNKQNKLKQALILYKNNIQRGTTEGDYEFVLDGVNPL